MKNVNGAISYLENFLTNYESLVLHGAKAKNPRDAIELIKKELDNKKEGIKISKSSTADTRTCDFKKVSKEQLLESSKMHIEDVSKGLTFFKTLLEIASSKHDEDKITGIEKFHSDFITGFSQTSWWDNHRKVSRHHLLNEDGVPDDVNLIDVLEMIADCVMAGMARAGSVYPLDISPEVLLKALENTVEKLKSEIIVIE
jgi:hypothetical protein